MGRAPAYTANMGAKYQFLKGWEVSTNVAFSDSYYSAYDNDSRGRIGSYWSANAQLAYTFAYGAPRCLRKTCSTPSAALWLVATTSTPRRSSARAWSAQQLS